MATVLLVGGAFGAAGFAVVPPDESEPLRQKELRHSDLWWGSVYRPVSDLPSELNSRLAPELSRLGVDPGHAFFDLRTGRWGTLIVTRPLVPGPGVGNDLDWSDLGRQAPRDGDELRQAAWEAFRGFLAVHSEELHFDLGELGEPVVSTLGSRMIRIHATRQLDGIPVRDTFITAAINSGNLVLMGQRNWSDLAIETRPSISSERAEEALRAHLGTIGYARLREAARLEIVPVSDEPDESFIDSGEGLQHRLVWVLGPSFEGDLGSWEALVDAHTGELVSFEDLNHHLSRRVEGAIFPVSNDGQGDDGTLQFGYPMPFADIALDGTPIGFTSVGGNVPPGADSGTISTTLSGQFVRMNDTCGAVNESAAAGDLDLDGVPLPGTDCQVPAGHSAGDTNASRSGFYELNRLIEQAQGYLPANTWIQGQLTANMNINQNCNAFWSNTLHTVNFYTSGGGCANTGEIAAIFDHEWGHGMDFFDGAPGISRPGEGIADIFAQNRLIESCIGRNFRPGVQCGGYGDPCLDCTGVRDVDYAKRASGLPHDISFILSNCTGTGNTPCGRGTHCEGSVVSESAWDLVHRDLQGFEGSDFEYDLNTALELGTRLSYHGSHNVVNWYQCVTDGTGGCNVDSGYLGYLAADDDNGDLSDGTPHMTAIFAAFNRHQIACATPTVQDFGCAGAPTTAPTNLETMPFDEGAHLTWDPVPDAVEYQIFRTEGVHGCDFGKALVGTTTATEFTEAGLRNGFEVLYSVMAVGASDACTSPMSACAPVIPVSGPSGILSGTVTNSVTTAPIQGVEITAAGPVTLGGLTLADGTYQIAAPVGTYDLTASMEGFFPQTVEDVEVTEGGTFTNDFALVPLPQTVDVTPASFSFEVFEGQSDGDTLNIGNIGNVDLTWNLTEAETDCGTPNDVPWLSTDPASGVTPPFDSVSVAVAVDATGVAPGMHEAQLCVNSDDPDTPVVAVPVSLNVVASPAIHVAPEAIIVEVEAGDVDMVDLTVSNLGSIALDWTIVQEARLRGLNASPIGRRPVMASAPDRSFPPLHSAAGVPESAVSPEIAAAEEAGIEWRAPEGGAPTPRAATLSPADVLQDGVLIVPHTTSNFIIALDPETGDVIEPQLIDITGTSGARREALLHPDGERVLLTSQTQDVVHSFSVEDGSYLGVFAPIGGQDESIINNVRGMDFHPVTGNLLVTSADSPAANRVVEFDLDGNFVRVFIDGTADGLTSPWDLLIRASDILVTNGIGDGTLRYDYDGNFLGVFESVTDFPEQIAFAANGNILISTLSNGLHEFEPDGTLVASYVGTVTSQAGIYELPNLNFLVTGSSGGTGVHELGRDNILVGTKISGTSYQINFVQSLDCTLPSWLSVNPTSGSTGPGGSDIVTATIDTNLLGLGEHTASICFESNDPIQPLVVVPVTLTVFGDVPMADISPSSFAVDLPLDGNTTETLNIGNVGQLDLVWSIDEADADPGCDSPVDVPWLSVDPASGTTPPMGGNVPVDVTIDALGLSGGVYEAALCISTNDGDNLLVTVPVTLTVEAPGADISPASFAFEVFEGGTDGGILNIGNLGTVDLDWSLAEAETDCSSPTDVSWLSAAPAAGTTPPGGSVPVDVSVDTAGLGPGVVTAQLCVTSNDTTAPLVAVPVELTVLAAPVIDVVPDSLTVAVEVDDTHVEPVEIHNLGAAALDWTIPTDSARGASDPLMGFTFKTTASTSPDPQNWNRISASSGSLENVQDDTGEATDVTFSWGLMSGTMSFIAAGTVAADAVPQYDYDLTGMNGYGFGSNARYFIELSGLDANAPYELWIVGYRATSAFDNLVEVSDGDVVNAFQFDQSITSGDNNGRFFINDQVGDDTQHWDDLALVTTSSSTGTLRIEWQTTSSQPTVIGAFAVRPLLNCALPDWLSIAPTSGSINPSDPPDLVSVTFDSTGLPMGVYADAFCVESNDPFEPVVPVPVTLHVVGQVPIADITPASFEVELPRDGNTTETLNVGNIGLVDLVWSIDEADAAASCDSPLDVPWLSASPTSGTTAPGVSDPVDVTIDALSLVPAVYEAALCVTTNDPDRPLVPIPVTLTVLGGTADITPGSFAFEVFEGGADGDILNIGNLGTVDLTWSLQEAETDCTTPVDVPWLSAAPTAGTTPPGGNVPVTVAVDSAGLAPGDYSAALCVATNDADAEVVQVPVELSVLAATVIDVVPDSLDVTVEVNDTHVEPVEIHNLGSATLNWTIPTDSARGASDPLIGFTYKTAASSGPDPQNWTRISTSSGSLANVQDDTGEATDVTFTWGLMSGSMSFIAEGTVAADAVPQYDYDLTGMNGYGFGTSSRYFIELSGLDANAPYEFWLVGYRNTLAIDNVVEVSDGDVVNAFLFNQNITSGDNNGRFIVNDQVANDTLHWNDLAFSTTSSSTGTIRFEWQSSTTQPTAIGAFAVRPLLNCALPDWLSIAPTSGSVDPDDPPDVVSVTFDTAGLGLGVHTDAFCVESNDPLQPVVQVPVTLTVTLPGDVAIIEGTVQSLGYCGADTSALEGATVEITGAQNDFTLTTDENGFYQAFLNETESPIDITVTAADHQPQTIEDISFTGGVTVVTDFDLVLDAPCATADPTSFSFELDPDDTATDTLTIGNLDGGAELVWTITTAEPPAVAGSGSSARRVPPAVDRSVEAELRGAARASSGDEAMDMATELGFELPSLRVINTGLGGIDCDGEPGIIIHDDGTVENGYSGNPATGITEVRFVDKFTPSAYPATFTSVCVAFVTQAGGPTSHPVDIVVFDDDGPGGIPGTLLGTLSTTVTGIPVFPAPTPIWNGVDISSLGLSIASGDVYIGARFAPLPTTPPNVFIGSDQSTDRPVGFAGGYWWNNNLPEGDWIVMQADPGGFPLYRSLMVRAVQGLVDCDNPTTIPWLSIDPAAGSTPAGASSSVQVSIDTTGLSPGDYSAGLCLASNDPVNPVTVVPVNLTVLGDGGPVADITPAFFDFEVPAGGSDSDTLNIGNLGDADLTWSIDEAESPLVRGGGGDWSDDFDSYATGSQIHGQGGWKGWLNDPTAGALVSDAESNSSPNALEIVGASDPVRELTGADSGQWTMTAWQFIPTDFTGTSMFIMLNTYNDSGTGLNWSTQVEFHSATNQVVNAGNSGGELPLIRGQWVELRVEIDLDSDTQEFYYGGELLYSGTWTGEVGASGALNIGVVDLFANNATAVYYDDVSLTAAGGGGGGCESPVDIPWLSTDPTGGTTPAGGTVPVDVAVDASALAPGDYSALLCVTTNDPAAALVEVPVDLTVTPSGPAPAIDVDPESLASTLGQGQTETHDLTISNLGEADLDWTIDTLEGLAGVTERLQRGSDIVVFDDINFTVPADFDGGSVRWDTGETCECFNPPFNFNVWASGANLDLAFFWPGSATRGGVSLDGGDTYAVLGPGATIGPDSQFITSATVAAAANWRQPDGVDAYLGFRFVHPDTELLNFGYVRLTTTGITGHPATIVGWAFNQVGDPITIPEEGPVTCDDPVVIPWLDVDPDSGTTAPAASTLVQVTVSTTGVGPGEHSAQLCIESNDPVNPVVLVPVSLTVLENLPIAEITPGSFEFEVSEGGSAGDILNIGNVGTLDLDWSIVEAEGVPRGGGNLVSDGGFESGTPNAFWAEGSSNFGTPLCTAGACGLGGGTGPHGGTWWAWFGGSQNLETGFVAQDVTIPAAGSAELRFWLEIPAAGTPGFLDVSLGGDVVFSVTQADAGSYGVYTEVVVDVSAYADGGTHALRFDSTTQAGAAVTNFFVDDVSLTFEAGPVACQSPVDIPWLSADPDAGTTPPSGTIPVDVSVNAAGLEQGSYSALLCVTTNDPAASLVEIPVTLTVVEAVPEPVLEFDPSSLDFGTVAVGETSPSQSSTLHNTGDADATDLDFLLSGSGDFDFDATTCGTTLPAGGSCPVMVTFTPTASGPAAATLAATSSEGASASLGLTGSGQAEGEGFTAMALEVDLNEMLSDGNRVFEPGELVEVAPSWRNDDTEQRSLEGEATSFTGPDGAIYTIGGTGDADYGLVDPGATASCLDTGDCYTLGVNDPVMRPATHWDAAFEETLSDDTVKTWNLHLGDSFEDVPPTSPFYRWIETLLHHEVTGGCSETEYCPTAVNTRGQMPVFVLRGFEGADFVPAACVPGEERLFADVPATSGFCPWIEELALRDVVAGCGGGNYCPDDAINRQQMAVFLLATLEGPGYTPPACVGIFEDVSCASPFAAWVEDLFNREITGGCSGDPLLYCPTDPVNRQQMAVFVSVTFGLELYGP